MNFLNNKKLLPVLKIALPLLMGWFIADRLFIKNNFSEQWVFFKQQLKAENSYLFFIAVCLVPINWVLETVKWRLLIKSSEPFTHLFKSVIAGTTLGFVTPGRSGEFIGRVLFIKEENKAKIFYLSMIGGIAQSVVTLAAGVFFVFIWNNNSFLNGITIGIALTFMIIYFRFDWLNSIVSSNSFLEKYNLIINNIDLPDITIQLLVLFIAFIRYAVYLLQYALLLIFFGVSSDFFQLLINSGVFLTAQTFSPMIPFLDVSYRGGTALFIFSNFQNSIGVLGGVMLVWIINLVIPSALGYFFIVRKKIS